MALEESEMKKLFIVLAIFVMCNCAKSQEIYDFSWSYEKYGSVIVDSIVWKTVAVDSLHLGKNDCNHIWTYSKEWRAGGNKGCLVSHNGSHCSRDDRMRDRICSHCMRKETQREFWYEHRKKYIETDYEKLEKK